MVEIFGQIEWASDFVVSDINPVTNPTYCTATGQVRRWQLLQHECSPSNRCVCWIGDLQQLVPTKLHSLSEYWQMLDIELNSPHLHIQSPTQIRWQCKHVSGNATLRWKPSKQVEMHDALKCCQSVMVGKHYG